MAKVAGGILEAENGGCGGAGGGGGKCRWRLMVVLMNTTITAW